MPPDHEQIPVLVQQQLHVIRTSRVLSWAESAHRALALYSSPFERGMVPLDSALEQLGMAEGASYLADKLTATVGRHVKADDINKYGVSRDVVDALKVAKAKATEDTPEQRKKDLKEAYGIFDKK